MNWHVPDDPPASGEPMTMPPAGPLPRGRSRHTVEVDVHASVGVVRPGDKLVVAVSRRLDMAERDDLRQQIEERLPGVEGFIIEADAVVVYRA